MSMNSPSRFTPLIDGWQKTESTTKVYIFIWTKKIVVVFRFLFYRDLLPFFVSSTNYFTSATIPSKKAFHSFLLFFVFPIITGSEKWRRFKNVIGRVWVCVSLCAVEYMRACLDESLPRKKQSWLLPDPVLTVFSTSLISIFKTQTLYSRWTKREKKEKIIIPRRKKKEKKKFWKSNNNNKNARDWL